MPSPSWSPTSPRWTPAGSTPTRPFLRCTSTAWTRFTCARGGVQANHGGTDGPPFSDRPGDARRRQTAPVGGLPAGATPHRGRPSLLARGCCPPQQARGRASAGRALPQARFATVDPQAADAAAAARAGSYFPGASFTDADLDRGAAFGAVDPSRPRPRSTCCGTGSTAEASGRGAAGTGALQAAAHHLPEDAGAARG